MNHARLGSTVFLPVTVINPAGHLAPHEECWGWSTRRPRPTTVAALRLGATRDPYTVGRGARRLGWRRRGTCRRGSGDGDGGGRRSHGVAAGSVAPPPTTGAAPTAAAAVWPCRRGRGTATRHKEQLHPARCHCRDHRCRRHRTPPTTAPTAAAAALGAHRRADVARRDCGGDARRVTTAGWGGLAGCDHLPPWRARGATVSGGHPEPPAGASARPAACREHPFGTGSRWTSAGGVCSEAAVTAAHGSHDQARSSSRWYRS